MKYYRNCPTCNEKISYSKELNMLKAQNVKSECKRCAGAGSKNHFFGKKHTAEMIQHMSDIKKNKSTHTQERKDFLKIEMSLNNPMAGRSFYDVWIEKFGKEIADEKMILYKSKKSAQNTGKNNNMYGKPSPNGSGNGWSGWYKGWFFRSIHELSFIINYAERFNMEWKTAESAKFMIQYLDYSGTQRNYFPDFIINDKYMVECKPLKLKNAKNVLLKKEAAIIFCKEKNIIYKIITPVLLSENKVKELYFSKEIMFTKKYEQKFIERHKLVL